MTAKTFFDWVHKGLLADCGLQVAPWQRDHAARASALFIDETLQQAATVLAVLHPHVLDYILQAPVLVLAAAAEKSSDLRHRTDRKALAAGFIAKAAPAHRLNAILKAYGVTPPLKRLDGALLAYRHHVLLPRLLTVPELALAQVIPHDVDAQRLWFYWLTEVVARCGPRTTRGREVLAWAVIHLDTPDRQAHTIEVLDWISAAGAAFHPRMRYGDAKAATDAWHRAQAALGVSRRRLSGLIDMRTAEYAPLPRSWTDNEGITLHALTTRADLEEESTRMHHCVRMYWSRLIDGDTRIYSVRREGKHVATLELQPERSKDNSSLYRRAQLKGPCNTAVATEISKAADAFVAAANVAVAKAAEKARLAKAEGSRDQTRMSA